MTNITISVIIPVYKTELYLKECLNSVVSQDYPHLDIILVDDGSPDRCPALCDELSQTDSRIRVIHKENQGLGMARNSGMEIASGDYIFFLDSDDKLAGPHVLRLLLEKALYSKADITMGSFQRFGASGVSGVNHHHLKSGSYSRTVDFRFKGFVMYGHLSYDWGKLYRKEFLDRYQLMCQPYPFTQDKAHNIRCCACEPRYAFLDDSIVLYRVNESSVTFRYKENLMPVWTSIAEDFEHFLASREIKQDYGDISAFHLFLGIFFLAKQELQPEAGGVKKAAAVLKEYGQNPFVRRNILALAKGKYVCEIHSLPWKVLIRAVAIAFSLHCYHLLVYSIYFFRLLQIDGKISSKRYQK